MADQLPSDFFDRVMGTLTMRNDVVKSEVSVKRVTDFHGATRTYNVQTFRIEGERDGKRTVPSKDVVFIEESSADGFKRHVLLPEVSDIVARQRDAVTAKMRKRGAAKGRETKAAKKGGAK